MVDGFVLRIAQLQPLW